MNKLRYLRDVKKITQDKIAKDLYINQKTYSRYETGVSEPDHETLKKLANYFGVTIDYLLDNNETEMIFITKEDFEQLIKASEIIERINKTRKNSNK